VRAVAVSPEERLLAGAGDDGVIRLWRAATPDETLNPPPR
jgi:hypothetical protein